MQFLTIQRQNFKIFHLEPTIMDSAVNVQYGRSLTKSLFKPVIDENMDFHLTFNVSSLKADSDLPKNCLICFSESPLKLMKNALDFILKAFFVLKIFKFLC